MVEIYLYTILSVLAVSIIALIGIVTLSIEERMLRKYLYLMVALAVGALLGDAFIHLIPESTAELGATNAALWVIGGILVFFVLEKVLHWHHHGDDEEHTQCGEIIKGEHPGKVHPVGYMIIASDALHNFLDGVIIAAAYFVSIEVGIATTLAVILHEIPQEIGDFGVLLHAGWSKARAILVNFLTALTALVGAVIVLILHEVAGPLVQILVPIAAGGFIYIAASDLIPELHKSESKKVGHSFAQLLAIGVGILAMFLLIFAKPEDGHTHEGEVNDHHHEAEEAHIQ